MGTRSTVRINAKAILDHLEDAVRRKAPCEIEGHRAVFRLVSQDGDREKVFAAANDNVHIVIVRKGSDLRADILVGPKRDFPEYNL